MPTLVPTESEMKQAARNSPASSMLAGSSVSAKLTVASIDPMAFALLAKAPAKIKIHIISIICPVPAPRQPPKVVYVSCDPATLARDVAELCGAGYTLEKAQAFDLFPRTFHVETVVLLSKGEIDSKKVRVEFSLEGMDMSGFQKGATYEQIKAYVLKHTGLKVSSLYISQVKRKCGLDVGQNYNLSKKENAKVPQCPPEKEAAIVEALKYFQMLE